MNEFEKILMALSLIIVSLIFALVLSLSREPNNLGGANNILDEASISTVEADSATTTEIVSANVGRKYLHVCNTDAEDVYCAIDETAVVGSGIFLDASGGCYTVDLDNLFIGAFNCIGDTSSSTLSVIEG